MILVLQCVIGDSNIYYFFQLFRGVARLKSIIICVKIYKYLRHGPYWIILSHAKRFNVECFQTFRQLR